MDHCTANKSGNDSQFKQDVDNDITLNKSQSIQNLSSEIEQEHSYSQKMKVEPEEEWGKKILKSKS